jgi:hypothetical protein
MACGKVTQQVNPDLSVGFSWGYASAGVDPAAFDGELQVAVEMHFERMRCNPDMLVRDMSFVVPATHLGSSSSALIERAMLTQTSSVLSGKAFTVSLSLKGADWGDGAGPSCHLTKLLNFTYTPSPVLNVRPADVPLGSAAALSAASSSVTATPWALAATEERSHAGDDGEMHPGSTERITGASRK